METLAFIGTLGLPEILVILLIIVVLFGAKKIPELMRGLGTGIKEFKKASSLDDDEHKDNKKIEP
ncbi:MAG: twin-arginine translocase TatA/TatE family subunit [Bacteroidota bacterium]